MRALAVAAAVLAASLAGCMQAADEDDWEPYDSGRGLGFGLVLTLLLIVGAVVLVTNLTGAGQAPPPPPAPPSPPPLPSPSPRMAGEPDAATGWEPVQPARAKGQGRTAAPKPAKPRRRQP